ncbi:MAG TPA: hypothetical protein DIV79_12910 [Opitutae bacterium]|nr:hypothetical protein [Opitutaceae bacterium]HCR30906.1 hypothetical protein [Opitutae bacterium]
MQEIWPQLRNWVANGTRFATATIVEASRPSPRGIGSVLAVRSDGEAFIGSVSAGCVESEVIEAAKTCMEDGKTRWLSFGPESGFPWEVALSCGGKIVVRVEPFAGQSDSEVGSQLAHKLDERERALLLSFEGIHCLISEDGSTYSSKALPHPLIENAKEHFRSGGATTEIEWDSSKALFRVLERPRRLFVVGAAHIAIHLVGFARSLGFETVVIDPREAYARQDRFPDPPHEIICQWPEQALKDFKIVSSDAIAAMTHDPKIDDQALSIFLGSEAGYIGALGSLKSHAARLKRLGKLGFDQKSLSRIRAPIGLDINSETPSEIALSVMSEVVQCSNAARK